MQRTDYRFTLTLDTDTFEVNPEGFFAGSYNYTQEEGQLFFRKIFNGELVFKKTDYNYIKSRYDNRSYCDIFELLIEKWDKDILDYVVDWTGYFSMTDGKFDFEKCQYKVTPTVQDKYTCLDNNKDVEVNILKVAPTDIDSYIKSVLEFEIRYSSSTTEPVSPADGMEYMTYRLRSNSPLTYVHIFARESILLEKSVTPSGATWVQLTNNTEPNVIELLSSNDEFNKWGRPWTDSGVSAPGTTDLLITYDVVNADCSITETMPLSLGYSGNYLKIMTGRYRCPGSTDSVSKHSIWIKKDIYSGALFNIQTSYLCRNLEASINYILDTICNEGITLNSDFLQNATNPVTGIASKTNNLYLIQKSDAKRPNASNPATKGNITFEALMSYLYSNFQIYWYVNDSSELVIIHQSEIENVLGIDITIPLYLKVTAHKKAIDFNKTLLYRFELWKYSDAVNEDFVGLPIEYNELCTVKESVSKTKTYSIDGLTTDLQYVQTAVDKISDEGFVLVATNGSDVLLENGVLSESLQLNGHLAISNLHDKYWRHNRILENGKMNGVDETFISTQKIRQLSEQSIIYCDEFDPLKNVMTELGLAKINEAQFFPLDNKLTLKLSI